MDTSLAAVVSIDTTTILTLNSTGEHHVEITANNTCNRISQAAVIIIASSVDSMTTAVATPSFSTEIDTPATSKPLVFKMVLA